MIILVSMCCLFGILDHGQSISNKQLNKMITVLSKSCELRGTDATGIHFIEIVKLYANRVGF